MKILKRNPAVIALRLEKEIRHLEKSIDIFGAERQSCIESIQYSVKIIQARWAEMERHDTRIADATKSLSTAKRNLELAHKAARRDELSQRKMQILKELEELNEIESDSENMS